MLGNIADRSSRRMATSIAAVFGVGLLLSGSASALEAFDGRIQAHGFAEMQLRALNEKFEQQLDLAQWYNVLNVELEVDILPDGWGPFDLLSAYVRVEGRYDCVWSHGCGMFPSVDTYGDDAHRLPDRLADAENEDYGGVIETGPRTAVNPHNRVLTLDGDRVNSDIHKPFPVDANGDLVTRPPTCATPDRPCEPGNEIIEDRGFLPGVLENYGADDIAKTADDPFRYTMSPYLDYGLAFKNVRNYDNGRTAVLGPWLPKNFIDSIGGLRNKANPFRGRTTPSPSPGVAGFLRYYTSDPQVAAPGPNGSVVDGKTVVFHGNAGSVRVTPDFANNPYLTNPDPLPSELAQYLPNTLVLPGRFGVPPSRPSDTTIDVFFGNVTTSAGTPVILTDSETFAEPGSNPFGGDYSGIVSCVEADLEGLQYFEQVTDAGPVPGCIPRQNVRVTGGTAELPLRPAPYLSNLTGDDDAAQRRIDHIDDQLDEINDLLAAGPSGASQSALQTSASQLELEREALVQQMETTGDWDPTIAQGLYIPSAGLIKYLNNGDFDSLDMNFRESERAWNRGASQQDLKELKEAYVDIEMLDSRLWMRLGLQQIVWGKTELFRTTDQFNPVDLALASIPSLEESRIALIAGRFTYSLYEVGPLEDVRLEFAFNFDQVEPADLGACGEPFTFDLVCSLTFGTLAHTYLGIGVAGVNRPASPWQDLGGLEIGGRVEWRWDRFSFAMIDFYGYDDIPSIDSLMTFERNVDLDTGRPLVTRYNPENERGNCGSGSAVSNPRDLHSVTAAGIGTDTDCLKLGIPFENSPQNALEFHHANQQIFAWVCSITLGIASALDAGACATTLFGSAELLAGLEIPFSEVLTPVFAGQPTTARFLGTIANAVSSSGALPPESPAAIQAINRDANDGFITALHGTSMRCVGQNQQHCGNGANQNSGVNQLPVVGGGNPGANLLATNSTNATGTLTGNLVAKLLPSRSDFITLDSGLTNEQRALLGCGPFWGTRCDSAAAMEDFDCAGIGGCQNENRMPFGLNNIAFRSNFWDPVFSGALQRGGGVDFLNMEGSVLVQSWAGVEGTPDGYIATSMATAPGTVNFDGGPVCTRYVPGRDTPAKLPGCRGIARYEITNSQVIFTFEENYDPRVDGCLVGSMIGNHAVRTLRSDGTDFTGSTEMMSCFGQLAPQTGDFDPLGPSVRTQQPCQTFVTNSTQAQRDAAQAQCEADIAEYLNKANSDSQRGDFRDVGSAAQPNYVAYFRGASTLYHPLAGCLTDAQIAYQNENRPTLGPRCNARPIVRDSNGVVVIQPPPTFIRREDGTFLPIAQTGGVFARDYDIEFLCTSPDSGLTAAQCAGRGQAQIFQNELAAVSYNFAMFLVVASGCDEVEDTDNDPECFDTARPFALDKCSFNQMYHCSAIKGLLGLAGVQRNTLKAGGNGKYGRRTMFWHSGQEVVLNYDKRNVFGFSMDFSEDHTKSSWGVEFAWFESVPFGNTDEFDGTHSVDTLNLTISADRPTFINFLNANRTFFFNTQWFFRYVAGHTSGTVGDEWDVLFTFAMFTGYFQDRLNPSLVTIYDFNSQSGGVLTSINYRFTEAFSATFGISLFFGRTEYDDMPVNPIAPATNRAGPHAYENGTDRFISNLRKRDEAWLRLRWTF